MQDTFPREALHTICHVTGLRETEVEENYACRPATGLRRDWSNNPAEFKWRSELVQLAYYAPFLRKDTLSIFPIDKSYAADAGISVIPLRPQWQHLGFH